MSNQPEPDPEYFGTATIAGAKFQLYRLSKKMRRARIVRWFAKLDVMSNDQLEETRSESPEAAIGLAILNLKENNQLVQKIWG
jgi:hypothetical protein